MHKDLERHVRKAQADPEDKGSIVSLIHMRSRLEGPDVFLEVLQDKTLWNRALIEYQDLAIKEVLRRLGKRYGLKETRSYSCHGEAYRIATISHPSSGLEFQLIPGGYFLRGSMRQSWEQPIQKLKIPPFLLGRYPVLTGQTLKQRSEAEFLARHKKPLVNVSWADAEILLKEIDPGMGLPSESFWEYACRSGSSSAYYWGETMDSAACWYDLTASEAQDVDLHDDQCNAFGLVDMLGNVSEWCADDFENGYFDHPSIDARVLTVSQGKVGRGGCYNDNEDYARCAARYVIPPERIGENIGFRAFRRF